MCIFSFWLLNNGDALGYRSAVFAEVLPLASAVTAFFIAKNNRFGKWKWLAAPVSFGLMYILADYMTFQLPNMIGYGKVFMPIWKLFPGGAVTALAGLLIGALYRKIKEIKGRKE